MLANNEKQGEKERDEGKEIKARKRAKETNKTKMVKRKASLKH